MLKNTRSPERDDYGRLIDRDYDQEGHQASYKALTAEEITDGMGLDSKNKEDLMSIRNTLNKFHKKNLMYKKRIAYALSLKSTSGAFYNREMPGWEWSCVRWKTKGYIEYVTVQMKQKIRIEITEIRTLLNRIEELEKERAKDFRKIRQLESQVKDLHKEIEESSASLPSITEAKQAKDFTEQERRLMDLIKQLPRKYQTMVLSRMKDETDMVRAERLVRGILNRLKRRPSEGIETIHLRPRKPLPKPKALLPPPPKVGPIISDTDEDTDTVEQIEDESQRELQEAEDAYNEISDEDIEGLLGEE